MFNTNNMYVIISVFVAITSISSSPTSLVVNESQNNDGNYIPPSWPPIVGHGGEQNYYYSNLDGHTAKFSQITKHPPPYSTPYYDHHQTGYYGHKPSYHHHHYGATGAAATNNDNEKKKKPVEYATSTQNFALHFPSYHHHHHPHQEESDSSDDHEDCNNSSDADDDSSSETTTITITTTNDDDNSVNFIDLSEMSASNASATDFLDLTVTQNNSKETTFLGHNVTLEHDDSELNAMNTSSEDFDNNEAITTTAAPPPPPSKPAEHDGKNSTIEKCTHDHDHADDHDSGAWKKIHHYHNPMIHQLYPKYTVFLPFYLVPATSAKHFYHYPPSDYPAYHPPPSPHY